MKHAKTSRIFSLLALVLAVTMLLTLVGCGNDSGKSDDTKKSNGPKTTVTTKASETEGTDGGENTTTDANTSETGGDPSESVDASATEGTGSQATGSQATGSKPTASKPTNSKATASQTKPTTVDVLKQVPKSLSGTKIKMQIWWNQADDDTKEAEAFKKATGISVAYTTSAMDKYQSNLSGTIMAGNPPALAAIINEWYPQPITRGLMQPIKNTGWDYTDPIYAIALMDQFSYKGEHYGIALKGSNNPTYEVLFFNKKVLKSFGVSKDPWQLWKAGQWNWDTCLDIAQKCTNAKKDKYGMTNISQFFWMLSAGQDFVLSDINGLKNNIREPKLLNTWYQAWDMIHTHKVIPANFSTQQQMFYSGSVAMMGGGSFFMQADKSHTTYVPQNMTDDWGVVPFPSPKGQAAVAACEGTVWGFPTKVKGDQLQAAMWFLRYYLDDSAYGSKDFYPSDECWEVMQWMSNQKIQSYNSVGVVSYGGKYNAWSIQYSVIDEATTRAQVASNLESWYAEIQTNIDAINSEMD